MPVERIKTNLFQFAPLPTNIVREPDVEHEARILLRKAGYVIHARGTGNKLIDENFPSKSKKTETTGSGYPDLFLTLKNEKTPFCVWENKSRNETALKALNECKFYIEGVHQRIGKNVPNLPRVAAGFNGEELLLAYYKGEGADLWCDIKCEGVPLRNYFPLPELFRNGVSSKGILTSINGYATHKDLRKSLWDLKTLYRVIPILAIGRTPIDFTVALLTLRMLVEMNRDWGTWAEQPALQAASTKELQIAERLRTLAQRIADDRVLKDKYGDIFKFEEKEGSSEVAFDFIKVLGQVGTDSTNFKTIFDIVDSLPPLLNADFDVFGEVYQNMGDDATKKALGEFFTGRHIIAGVVPVIFERSGLNSSLSQLKKSKIADIAAGTGGFLTESLRYCKNTFPFANRTQIQNFAQNSFYGFDLSHANASRARVNMYFAGDGFSELEGGIDSLTANFITDFVPKGGFNLVMTNPPYGKSKYGLTAEVFLMRFLEVLKKGIGWGLIVLPTGVLENPRSALKRFKLIKEAKISDVISLPKHAFAPYTQQKTAIVILQKRKEPLNVSDGNWEELKKATIGEEVSFYIIDNDGFANSDKRYPTDRTNANGEWLHNELSKFIDRKGEMQASILYQALINGKKPKNHVDEFNNETGAKYGKYKASKLFIDKDVKLLPEIYLRRRDINSIPESVFISRCEEILSFLNGNGNKPFDNLRDRIKEILSLPIENEANQPGIACFLPDLFTIKKGNPGFTEEVIYKYYDDNGIPVYGGGAEPPRFKVRPDTKTKSGKNIDIYTGPAIILSMDGSSGAIRVIEEGTFCLNHHGAVLKPVSPTINLHWVAQQCEYRLKQLASNQAGSATLTEPQLSKFALDVPIPCTVRDRIGNMRKLLLDKYTNLFE